MMQAALESFEFQTETVWIWYGIAFLLGCIALIMGVSVLGLTWISPAHARPSVAVVNQTIAAKRASRDHDKMRQKVERRELRYALHINSSCFLGQQPESMHQEAFSAILFV